MNRYARRAGPLLKDRLEEIAGASPDERHSLADEIDVARVLADRHVAIYESVVMKGEGSDELKALATASLRGSLNHVSTLVSRAARVHAVSASVIELEHINYIVSQVVAIIEDEVTLVDKALADRVINRFGKIKLPEGKNENVEENAERLRKALAEIDDTIS